MTQPIFQPHSPISQPLEQRCPISGESIPQEYLAIIQGTSVDARYFLHGVLGMAEEIPVNFFTRQPLTTQEIRATCNPLKISPEEWGGLWAIDRDTIMSYGAQKHEERHQKLLQEPRYLELCQKKNELTDVENQELEFLVESAVYDLHEAIPDFRRERLTNLLKQKNILF